MKWTRDGLTVERVGSAVWLCIEDRGILVDCPEGSAAELGSRLSLTTGIMLTSGRIDRVSGLLGMLHSGPVREVWVPLSDDRGASLVEAYQRAWGHSVIVDALRPGDSFFLGSLQVKTQALRGEDRPSMGVRFEHHGISVAYLPRCEIDGAARRIAKGADLVIVEPSGMSTSAALQLPDVHTLWLEPVGQA